MIRTKSCVSLDRVSRRLFNAIATADQVWHWAGVDECWVTSGNDGKHMKGSKHYAGEAADLRSKNIPKAIKRKVLADLSRLLGNDWDVILEYVDEPNEHFHIEYDPR